MFRPHVKRTLAAILSASLILSPAFPGLAFANTQVELENHATASEQADEIGGLIIGDVDKPEAGKPLDGSATAIADTGASWDIPVLWIGSDLQLATEAVEGRTYLPVLAFFVPAPYKIRAEGGTFKVLLADELVSLFGGNEIVSVYNPATGITYILPAALRDYFTSKDGRDAKRSDMEEQTAVATTPAENQTATDIMPAADVPAPDNVPIDETPGFHRPLVEIYCAKTARDALSNEDLEWLIDLMVNKLEPQAVNLLLKKFPALKEAASNNEIGKSIGLYIYYAQGDKDGIRSHEHAPSDALAYVSFEAITENGACNFGYTIGINAASLVEDPDDDSDVDPITGKKELMRNDAEMETLENTIVHELFHALTYDYTRTGMVGALNMADIVLNPDGSFVSPEQAEMYSSIRYPRWFVEGSASAVENVYQYRKTLFSLLGGGGLEQPNAYTAESVVNGYLNAKVDEDPAYFDLWYCGSVDEQGMGISNEASAYVSGYLATLYLCELQARKNGTSSIDVNAGGTRSISSETLLVGLNDILRSLHDGYTFDELVLELSPVDGASGEKLYNNCAEFQKKFIKGAYYSEDDSFYSKGDCGEGASVPFVVDLLNYLNDLNNQAGKRVNGTILDDFSRTDSSMISRFEDDASDFLRIVDSNRPVTSTVPDSVALMAGGLTKSGTEGHADTSPFNLGDRPRYYVVEGRAPIDNPETTVDEATETVTQDERVVVEDISEQVDSSSMPLAAKATNASEEPAATSTPTVESTNASVPEGALPSETNLDEQPPAEASAEPTAGDPTE